MPCRREAATLRTGCAVPGAIDDAIVGSPVSGIVRTAPYRYATAGERVGPFDARVPDAVLGS